MEISWDFFKEHGDLLNEFLLDSGSPLLLVSAQKVISVVQVADMTNTAVFISLFMWDTYSSDDFLITRQDSPPPPPPHHHPFSEENGPKCCWLQGELNWNLNVHTRGSHVVVHQLVPPPPPTLHTSWK